jgi:hypothetical protein
VVGVKQSRVYSVCEGELWTESHSDEMEKDCWMKNGSKNAKRDVNFVQMHDANEEDEDWETEIVRIRRGGYYGIGSR